MKTTTTIKALAYPVKLKDHRTGKHLEDTIVLPKEWLQICGSDGLNIPRKAISDHCNCVTKRYAPTSNGDKEMSFIPESDLYRCDDKHMIYRAYNLKGFEVLEIGKRHKVQLTVDLSQLYRNHVAQECNELMQSMLQEADDQSAAGEVASA